MSKEDLDTFMGIEAMFSSPSCSALKTCLSTTRLHPTLMKKGVTLLRNLRESKNFGGKDTMAEATKDEISKKALESTKKYTPEVGKELESVSIDYNDANEKWWTTLKDTKADLENRYNDLISYLRFRDEKVICCVGHSLFFRGWMRRYLGEG